MVQERESLTLPHPFPSKGKSEVVSSIWTGASSGRGQSIFKRGSKYLLRKKMDSEVGVEESQMSYQGVLSASWTWNGEKGFHQNVDKQDWDVKKGGDHCYGLELYFLWYSLQASVKIRIAFKYIDEKHLMPCNSFFHTSRLSASFPYCRCSQILSLFLFPRGQTMELCCLALKLHSCNCWWKQSQQDKKISVFLIPFCILT